MCMYKYCSMTFEKIFSSQNWMDSRASDIISGGVCGVLEFHVSKNTMIFHFVEIGTKCNIGTIFENIPGYCKATFVVLQCSQHQK